MKTQFLDKQELSNLTNLATPIWVFNIDKQEMWWANSAALEFWEATSLQELLERDYSSDSSIVNTRLQQLTKNSAGVVSRIQDTWTLYPNDTPKTALLSFLAVQIEDGLDALLVEVIHEIEIDSSDQSDELRILDSARASMFLVSSFKPNGQLIIQNPASLDCYGSPNKLTDKSSNHLAARFTSEKKANDLLNTVFADKEVDDEISVITKQGERIHHVRAHKSRDPISGDWVAVLNEEDITERIQLQRKLEALNETLEVTIEDRTKRLRESEERYSLAVNTAAIWDWDFIEESLFVSPSFLNALSYHPTDFDNKQGPSSLTELMHPEDTERFNYHFNKSKLSSNLTFEVDARFVKKCGRILWFQLRGRFIVDNLGSVFRSVGLMTDITERKELEKTLLSNHRLEAIGQLTGGIAHDFNNLLSIILGSAELLDLNSDNNRELVSEIRKAVDRGSNLTKHLLAFSRRQTLQSTEIDLQEMVNGLQNSILQLIGENIQITTHIEEDLWPVLADVSQIENAILNLSINARDAMPNGGTLKIICRNYSPPKESDNPIVPTPKLTEGEYVQLTVTDNGTGMPNDVLAKSIEPYFTTKEVGHGSGLGLSMVYGLSKQSGGDTVISSKVGEGTQVYVYLPRSYATAKKITQTTSHTLHPGNGESIHILEDNPLIRTIFSRLLESLNYKVTVSKTADEALAIIEEIEHLDLLLTDIVLPGGKDGLTFAKEIRNKRPEIKILLISGFPSNYLSENMSIDGSLVYLQKPVKGTVLSRNIHDLLNNQAEN